MNKRYNKGMTLIEVMIVVVIVGILAAIAYPSYQNYVIRANRGAATACLLELSQFMERLYTQNMTYSPDPAVPLAALTCRNDLADVITLYLPTEQREHIRLQPSQRRCKKTQHAGC